MARNQKIDAGQVLEWLEQEGPDAVLSRGQAVAVLDRLLDGRTSYERRKEIGNRLDLAIQPRGSRSRIPPITHTSAGFTSDDLAHWALALYGQALKALPQRPRVQHLTTMVGDVAVFADRAEMECYPGDLERCHAEMRRMFAEIRELTRVVADKDRLLAGKEQEFSDRQTARLGGKK